MSTNKHAVIRYQALDRCFRNTGRNYGINDLLEECNTTLRDFDPRTEGIKRRQLYEDIRFMESEAGYGIDLVKSKNGKEVFYRYSDPKFSINNKGLNETEASQIKQALLILARFKGMPQFEWVEEAIAKFEASFNLRPGAAKIIEFDENKDYTAVKYITPLFNAILYHKPLNISYQGFKQGTPSHYIFHPYYLKEYNNRWFCFGLNNASMKITTLALDRILEIADAKLKYIRNTSIDFDEYFDDVIGVTVQGKVEKVELKISNELWPYISTKPLHGTQKIKSRNKDYVIISIEVKPNYELQTLILSHGEKIEVMAPLQLKKTIVERAGGIK